VTVEDVNVFQDGKRKRKKYILFFSSIFLILEDFPLIYGLKKIL